jgi:hypothetical protein
MAANLDIVGGKYQAFDNLPGLKGGIYKKSRRSGILSYG